MSVDLSKIKTEQRNEKTKDLDLLSTKEIVTIINNEDKLVALAVEKQLDNIAKMSDEVAKAFENGGRLIYMGAGTSGRIGIMDAVECKPTFGVSLDMVRCLMAGGKDAFVVAVEGAEDNKENAVKDLKEINFSAKDVLVGLAASGRTPYVISGCEYAKSIGAITGCVVTTPNSPLADIVDVKIEVITGPEVVTGSTRMKSGTAQKMVCNMISTTSMIKIGHVYQNLMVDVLPTNEKLVARSINIIKEITGLSSVEAKEYFLKYCTIKNAVYAYFTGITDKMIIEEELNNNNNNLRKALEKYIK